MSKGRNMAVSPASCLTRQAALHHEPMILAADFVLCRRFTPHGFELVTSSRRKVDRTPYAATQRPAPLASAANPNIVRTLWHGSALSIYEELSLRSFVKCGHEVEVYAYETIDVPQGVRLVRLKPSSVGDIQPPGLAWPEGALPPFPTCSG